MFKLWAKQYDENRRIIKNDTFSFKQEFNCQHLPAYLQVICNEWKTESPMVLSGHIISFDTFNQVQFNKSDFVDVVEFEFMTLQLIP